MDIHVILVEPEIPQNTGNIVRTCAAIGAELHLIEPLGFSLADRYLKRAGLDYWSDVKVQTHADFGSYLLTNQNRRLIYTTKRAHMHHSDYSFPATCGIVFGKETAGLPADMLAGNERKTVRIPMASDIRSLNLSNAVAVLVYEALRQHGYPELF
jgi:tRNA (cytidine/uridine-2'-O-)-methyltransferase